MKKKRSRGLTKDKSLFEISNYLINEGISMRDARSFLLKKRKNKKGQAGFIFLIITLLTVAIFIFASPILFEAVGIGVAGAGQVEGWIIKLFPWVILITVLAVGYRYIFGGGG